MKVTLPKYILPLYFVLLSFLTIAQPSNDNFANAIDIDALKGTCSTDAQYTTVGGTSDLNQGSLWNNSDSLHNTWFVFTAPQNGAVSITVDIGSGKGSQTRTQAALWASDGITEINSTRYQSNGEDVVISADSLTAGSTYYISVDARNFSRTGTFSLCFDSILDYDYISAALRIDSLKGSCSSDAAFTTVGASSDGIIADCWNNSNPKANRWFEFTAATNGVAVFTVDIGSGKGTQTRTEAAIWLPDGVTQVACSRYGDVGDDVEVSSVALNAGQTYLMSVDVQTLARRGTFTLCYDTIPTYDYFAGAIDIDSLKGTCSPDAQYTTASGTGDLNAGSTWNNSGPLHNKWFKFTAPSTGKVDITIDIADSKGGQRRSQAAIWESNGTDEVASSRYTNNEDDISVSSNSVTPGATYYLSVDAYNTNNNGTFTICFDTTVTYDYFAEAIDIDSLKGTCSPDAQYTTKGASADYNAASCWNNSGPNFNRWFKFTAPTTQTVDITIDINDGKGDQRRTQAAIWENPSTAAVACSRYSGEYDDVTVSSVSLTAGQTYYLSVDVFNVTRCGSFSICFDTTATYDYFSAATSIDSLKGTCSPDAQYTLVGASGDLNAGSNWNNSGPLHNRWFSFTAPANGFVNLTVDIGGVQGDLTRSLAAIWADNGTTEIASQRYRGNNDDIVVSSDTLTPGATYYLSVDVQATGRAGSFTLCYDTIPNYDFYDGAISIDSILGTCSPTAAYSTYGASGDLTAGDCWNNSGPKFNRWFKFVAPSTGVVGVTVNINDVSETQSRTQAALWSSNGTTKITCSRYTSASDDIELNSDDLIAGDTYYISVDAFGLSYTGGFSLCIDTTPSYDFYEGAIDVTSTIGGCSNDAEYTTVGGTPDLNAGGCWNNSGPLYNRWFKFTAPSNGIANITVDIGNGKGTQRRSQLALWESNGTSPVGCTRYSASDDDVALSETGLTAGDTYYVSVDALNANNDGSFTLCIDSNPGYDYYEGAYELTDLNNWCSADEEFTTVGGTPDLNAGDDWNNSGPLFNRWFKFTALSSDFTVTVDIGSGKGTQTRTQLALWESNGTDEIDSKRYVNNGDDVSISTTSLTAGNTYYISVDAFNSNRDGTFSLCVSNVAGSYYSRQDGNWDSTATWSATSYSGPSAGSIPGPGDVVYIEGALVTITGTDSIAGIGMSVESDSTGIIVDGGSLLVLGSVNDTCNANYYGGVQVKNSGTLDIRSDYTILRSGGNEVKELDIESGAELLIGGDLSVISSGGTVNNTTVNIDGDLTLTGGFNLDHSGSGIKTLVTIGTSGEVLVSDIDFNAGDDDKLEIEINGSGVLKITGSVSRGSPAYGIIDGNDNSTVEFIGSSNQILPSITGSGTGDDFSFENVIINNSFSGVPAIKLEGSFEFNGDFAFTDGIVSTEGYDFTVLSNSTISGGNAGSYLDGKMIRVGNSDFTFQVGDGAYWAPVELNNYVALPNQTFEVEYFSNVYSDTTTIGDELVYISTAEYWNIDQTVGSATVDITLHFKDSARSGIQDPADLLLGHYDGTDWESNGNGGYFGSTEGYVTGTSVSSFSPFSFGFNKLPVTLPVELIAFNGVRVQEDVYLNWTTISEVNNEKFEIERSFDGVNYEWIQTEFGQGSTSEETNYAIIDFSIPDVPVYYRLKQIDFDGEYSYSKVVLILTDNGQQESNVKIYPNPNSENTVFILDGRGEESSQVRLMNSKGAILQIEENIDLSNGKVASVQFNEYISVGVYYLQIISESSVVLRKLIIQ